MAIKRNLDQLIESTRRRAISASFRALSAAGAMDIGPIFADVTGYHVYADLDLNLGLSAAEDDANARLYLKILEDYADLADASAKESGARLLEVQGERLHLVLPAPAVTEDSLKWLFRFSHSLTKAVYEQIKPLAGDHFRGFAMAADHGRAIVIVTGNQADDSVVSLGNPANMPAKRLAQTPCVPSGYLAIPLALAEETEFFLDTRLIETRRRWISVNVLNPPQYLETVIDENLTESMEKTAGIIKATRQALPLSVHAVDARYFSASNTKSIGEPVKVQAFCLRADLDGFTRNVQAAFAVGTDEAIAGLVQEFVSIMAYTDQFARALNRNVITLPWAGDCATLLVPLKPGETYESLRPLFPATIALAWHKAYDNEPKGRKAIHEAMGDARWAVGIAGGDTEEGSEGFLLLANLPSSDRDFMVVAGWGARRALDAQQAQDVRANDSVVHVDDYEALDPIVQDAFTALSNVTIFRRATIEGLERARRRKIEQASAPKEIEMPYIKAAAAAAPLPISRPYWDAKF